MEYMSPIECAVLPRQAAEAGEPGGAGEGHLHRRVHRHADRARADDGAHAGNSPSAKRRSPARVLDEIRHRLEFLCGGRPRLPEPGAVGGHALRRRGAAHPAGHADRLEAARRAVRAGRAVDRTASARQRPAARDAQPAARSGQHGAGGGARCGDDRARRLRDRSRTGRGTAGRRSGWRRDAERDSDATRLADRPVSVGQASDRRPRRSAATGNRQASSSAARASTI